jgi:hypothetical protein
MTGISAAAERRLTSAEPFLNHAICRVCMQAYFGGAWALSFGDPTVRLLTERWFLAFEADAYINFTRCAFSLKSRISSTSSSWAMADMGYGEDLILVLG